MKDMLTTLKKPANRRSFMRQSLAAGGAAVGVGLLGGGLPALGSSTASPLPSGDVAILKFLAAAELIEADLWQQYAELGGVTMGRQNPYQVALQNLEPAR